MLRKQVYKNKSMLVQVTKHTQKGSTILKTLNINHFQMLTKNIQSHHNNIHSDATITNNPEKTEI